MDVGVGVGMGGSVGKGVGEGVGVWTSVVVGLGMTVGVEIGDAVGVGVDVAWGLESFPMHDAVNSASAATTSRARSALFLKANLLDLSILGCVLY